jgi:Cas7 group CRISPR-associated protein Csh2
MFGSVNAVAECKGEAVWGPIVIPEAYSICPITTEQLDITRKVQNSKKEESKKTASPQTEDEETEDSDVSRNGTFGDKWIVPHGLYTSLGYYDPNRGQINGVTSDDLEVFFKALEYMWQTTGSANRHSMLFRGLYIFSHPNLTGAKLSQAGIERRDKIANVINITLKESVETPRDFEDYTVTIDKTNVNPNLHIFDWGTQTEI